MKKNLLLVFILLISVSFSFSQEVKKAYIITLKGDTIHGYMDMSNWGMNPSKILFKTYPGDVGTSYDPYDIRQFGMNGEIWQGGFVDVELSSRDINNLSTTADLYLEKDLVFLQALIKGEKSLYLYSKGVHELFYIKRDTIFELLAYKKYLKDESKADDYITKNVIRENKRYLGQLIVYFEDCPEIKSKINKTKYEKEDLERLFYQYYDCVQTDFVKLKPVKNISLDMGLTLGYGFTTIDFKYIGELATFRPIEPTDSKIISFGASLELSRPVSAPKWSIYNDLTVVTGYKYSIDTTGHAENYDFHEYFDYTTHAWKLVNMLRYKHFTGDVILFANAGLSSEFMFGKCYWQMDKQSILINKQVFSDTYKKTMYVAGLSVGAGVAYKHLSLELRSEPVHSSEYFSPTVNVLLNYRF